MSDFVIQLISSQTCQFNSVYHSWTLVSLEIKFRPEVFINDHVMGFLYASYAVSTACKLVALPAKQLYFTLLLLVFSELSRAFLSLSLVDCSHLEV